MGNFKVRILHDGIMAYVRVITENGEVTMNLDTEDLRMILRDVSEVIWGHYKVEPR